MPSDFPNSPSNNATYNAGGKTWLYNGSAWVLVGVSTTLPVTSYNVDGGTASTNYGGVIVLDGGGAV